MRTLVAFLLCATGVFGDMFSRDGDLEECVCFNKTSDSSCTGSISSQCEDYYKSVGWTLWPAAIGLLFFLIILPVIRCARRCCNCCGGKKPSEGCCCPSNEPHSGYSSCETCSLKLFIFAGTVLIAGLTIVILVRSRDLKDGVEDLGEDIDNFAKQIDTAADTIVIEYNALSPLDTSDAVRQEIQDAAWTAKNQTEDITDGVNDMYNYDHKKWYSRHYVTIGICCAMLFVFIISSIVALCNIKTCLPSIAMSMLSMAGLLFCIVVVVYQVSGVVMTDVCDNYNTTTGYLQDRIESKLGCNPGATTGLVEMITNTEQTKTAFTNRVCDAACNGLYNCPLSCSPKAFDTIELILDNSSPVDTADPAYATCGSTPAQCTVRMCATTCAAGSIRTASQQIVGNITTYVPSFNNITTHVYPVANCSILTQFVDTIESPVCNTLKDGAVDSWALTMGILILAIALSFVLLLGQKRFGYKPPYAEVGHAQPTQPHTYYPQAPGPITNYGTAA
eukprot:TRINITY_DN14491_c0_g1_i1.p1 TRINITY_DN14491_c0_g1~~TRINITY_DN14491_c0_g1_i1.p1  ORF type:complete len:505 (+),score=95.63 TRINITY_DN14491_c0_g1_i1:48-1562(+)